MPVPHFLLVGPPEAREVSFLSSLTSRAGSMPSNFNILGKVRLAWESRSWPNECMGRTVEAKQNEGKRRLENTGGEESTGQRMIRRKDEIGKLQ